MFTVLIPNTICGHHFTFTLILGLFHTFTISFSTHCRVRTTSLYMRKLWHSEDLCTLITSFCLTSRPHTAVTPGGEEQFEFMPCDISHFGVTKCICLHPEVCTHLMLRVEQEFSRTLDVVEIMVEMVVMKQTQLPF